MPIFLTGWLVDPDHQHVQLVCAGSGMWRPAPRLGTQHESQTHNPHGNISVVEVGQLSSKVSSLGSSVKSCLFSLLQRTSTGISTQEPSTLNVNVLQKNGNEITEDISTNNDKHNNTGPSE